MIFRILPFFGRSAEKKIVELMKEHLEKTLTVNEIFVQAADAVIKEKYDAVEKKAKEVSIIEHEADGIRREILFELYKGAFLPGMRTQLCDLVNTLDEVTNKIQDSVQAFVYLRGKNFPSKMKDTFSKIVAETSKSILSLKKVLSDLLEGKPELREHIKEVGILEHNVDLLKKEIFDYVLFEKRIDVLSVVVICDVMNFVSDISDMAEKSCDRIELLKILRQA